jgi:hypothetical protein
MDNRGPKSQTPTTEIIRRDKEKGRKKKKRLAVVGALASSITATLQNPRSHTCPAACTEAI